MTAQELLMYLSPQPNPSTTITSNPNNQKMNNATAKSYTLRTESGQWLGQVVLTSDGMFASVTDYGNLSYCWRHTGMDDFREFILGLEWDYFGTKLYTGMSYIAYGKKIEHACNRYAQKILPALKTILRKEIAEEKSLQPA